MEDLLQDKPIVEIAVIRKRFLYVLVALTVNLMIGSIFVLRNSYLDIDAYNKTSIFWLVSGAAYATACSLYFSSWGRTRAWWGVVILFTLPLSILVTFPYISYRAYSHQWHSNRQLDKATEPGYARTAHFLNCC